MTAGLAAIRYALPAATATLDELEAEGLLVTPRATLEGWGFRRIHRATDESAFDLAVRAASALLDEEKIDPASIDVVLDASALPDPARRGRDPLALFRYPATRLQIELGLHEATVTAVAQSGCASMFAAVAIARDRLAADPGARRILCVGSDVLPAGSRREILYNVVSDGACAVLVERDAPNRILSYIQRTKGFYWSPKERTRELIATYFPTAKRVVEEALARSSVSKDDLALVLPHNVSERSWEILLDLLGIPPEKLWRANIAAKGHTIAADPFMNLRDAIDAGALHRGDKALLFTFGFGAHWAAIVVEH